MAWKLHPSDEPMIDPFNAPDPVMPTDEPSLEAPDSSDGSERLRKHELQRRLERARAEASRGHRAPEHRSSSYTPPTESSQGPVDVPAPSSATSSAAQRTAPDTADESSWLGTPSSSSNRKRRSSHRDRHAWHRTAEARRAAARQASPGNRAHARRLMIYIIVIVIILSGAIGPLFVACSAVTGDLFDQVFDSGTASDADIYDDYDDYGDTDSPDYEITGTLASDAEESATMLTQERLDSAIAGTNEETLQIAEDAFTQAFETYSGLTPDEAGIDARAVAERVLANLSYNDLIAYAYTETSDAGYDIDCTVYYSIETPQIDDIAYDLRWNTPSSIWETYRETGTLDEESREALAAELETILADLGSNRTEYSTYLEFTGTAQHDGSGLELELDQDVWESEMGWIIG
ncbi:hypothetical protein H6A08_00935 [Enorma massiliensis]|uniref:hypothetical protein n=1 Tax=Enorma massiliensis TaxID=1472761 RepID=UPI00195CF86D|nr:hypothetical protein [Enorma massiliensis]MBM6782941.1 hypothetical protein [Enorma massiliensis]